MSQLSIRWRLTLWYGVSIAVMLCVFALLLFIILRQQIIARTDAGLLEEVKEMTVEVKLAVDEAGLRAAAEKRFAQHSFYDFVVSGEQGHVVFSSAGFVANGSHSLAVTHSSAVTHFETHIIDGSGPYRVASAIVSSSFGRLHVQVYRELSALYTDLKSLQLMMTVLAGFGTVISLAIGHLLTRRALDPVQKVVDVANSINISCLDRRIEVPNSDDEIGRLAASLNSLIERLEKAVAEIQRFTADASHEIRTPITTLRLEAEATLQSTRSTEEYEHALAIVVDEATRLSRLTDQLLHLSRHDAGIIGCDQDVVQLDALLTDVTDQLRPLATSRGIEIEINSLTPTEVLGDDIRLSQAIFNVLDNAIKYTPHDGYVCVQLRSDAKEAIIDISDTGIGIAGEYLPRIFDRFFRVDSSREIDGGGSGLGLSIARTAVAAHGGTIDVKSELKVGTIITIRLPLLSDLTGQTASELSHARP